MWLSATSTHPPLPTWSPRSFRRAGKFPWCSCVAAVRTEPRPAGRPFPANATSRSGMTRSRSSSWPSRRTARSTSWCVRRHAACRPQLTCAHAQIPNAGIASGPSPSTPLKAVDGKLVQPSHKLLDINVAAVLDSQCIYPIDILMILLTRRAACTLAFHYIPAGNPAQPDPERLKAIVLVGSMGTVSRRLSIIVAS